MCIHVCDFDDVSTPYIVRTHTQMVRGVNGGVSLLVNIISYFSEFFLRIFLYDLIYN